MCEEKGGLAKREGNPETQLNWKPSSTIANPAVLLEIPLLIEKLPVEVIIG
jgi:hypothetical protein